MRHVKLCCCVLLLAACSKGDDAATDTATGTAGGTSAAVASGTTAGGAAAGTVDFARLAGKWNVRAVPEAGTDTTPTLSVLTATGDTSGWTVTFPGRAPIPVRVTHVAGDSIVTEIGPYESVRRKGLRVDTRGTIRLQGDKLVGQTIARYRTSKSDSILMLRTEGTRAP
jgi:hypothetical protein